MDPSLWGPHAWKTLHAVAAHADTTGDAEAFRTYMNALRNALPCKTCQAHMTQYMNAHPLPSEHFFDYTVAFHNDVNVRLGKPEVTPDIARAEFARASCSQACNSTDESQNQAGVVVLYVTIMVSTLLIFLFLRNAVK